MIEHGQRMHLLRDGEPIDAVITRIPERIAPSDAGCSLELAWQDRRLEAYGTDADDVLVGLRGALEADGLFLNLRTPLRA